MEMEEKDKIEKKYQYFKKNMSNISSDSILELNQKFIDSFEEESYKETLHNKGFFFQVIEEEEKLTLFNEEFIVWIVPRTELGSNLTNIFIAKNNGKEEGCLELVLFASGIYNSSKIILQIIEKLLLETQENEEYIQQLKIA